MFVVPFSLPPRSLPRESWILVSIGGVSMLLGVIVMAGWALHMPALVKLRPDLPAVQFNTAICFILAGLALGASTLKRSRFVPQILGALAASVGGLTVLEYVTQSSLGIDQLFFHSDLATQVGYAGRMSAISAVCFLLIGLGLIQLGLRRAQRYLWLLATLASVVVSAALLALLGYALGLPGAYQWGQLSRIAPHTAVGLMILGGGLGYAAWQKGVQQGESTPRWLPLPLGLGVLTGALVLYFALDAKQNDELTLLVRSGATNVQRQVKLRVESRARGLTRMARRWEFAGVPNQAAWEFDAGLYTQDFPDIQAVEWIDPQGHIRWIVPMAGNEPKINLDAAREARRAAAMEGSRKEHRAVLSGAVALFRGGTGVIMYTPVQKPGGEFEGWIAAVFEVQAFLDRYLPPDVAADQALRLSDQGKTFYTRAATAPFPAQPGWVARETIDLPGATWDVVVWPTPSLAGKVISALPIIVLVVGVLDALLLAGICHLAQRHSRASRAHAATAAKLQEALDEVKTLEGLLPICSCCKRVRDDTGYWNQIDTYLHRNTDAKLSHGYCPECAAKAFTEFGLAIPERIQAELAAHNYE